LSCQRGRPMRGFMQAGQLRADIGARHNKINVTCWQDSGSIRIVNPSQQEMLGEWARPIAMLIARDKAPGRAVRSICESGQSPVSTRDRCLLVRRH
jgi:hypothetical protein